MRVFKLFMILTAILGTSLLMGITLNSVQAVDETKTSSRITIRLSEPAAYEFEQNGNDIYVSLNGVKPGSSEAGYRRLSHVIDYITLSGDESGSRISIRMMDQFRVSHYASGSTIVVQIGNPPPVKEKAPVSVPGKSLPQTAKANAAAPVVSALKDSLASPDSTVIPAPAPAPKIRIYKLPFLQNLGSVISAHPVIYGLCALLILALLVILLLPKRSAHVPQDKKNPDLGLNGATLIMDSETKLRMITKLTEEGWTPQEISREIKLSLKEVEQIVSGSRFGE